MCLFSAHYLPGSILSLGSLESSQVEIREQQANKEIIWCVKKNKTEMKNSELWGEGWWGDVRSRCICERFRGVESSGLDGLGIMDQGEAGVQETNISDL